MTEVTGLCNHHGDKGGEVSRLSVLEDGWNRFNAFSVEGEVSVAGTPS